MSEIPKKCDNPNGSHQRYVVTKANGDPVDPNAIYFVLRIDSRGKDRGHILASRSAALAYCKRVEGFVGDTGANLRKLALDLRQLIERIEFAEQESDLNRIRRL